MGCLSTAEQLMANSLRVPTRRTEFMRSRWLAKRLMGSTETIGRGPHGNPIWPLGWQGSITHKSGHVAVAVTPQGADFSIGIDLERGDRVGEHLAAKICTPSELELLSRLESQLLQEHQPAQVFPWRFGLLGAVFSIKEALFKSHFPIGQKFFYFHDAEISSIEFNLVNGIARGQVCIDTSPTTLAGTEFQAGFKFLDLDGARHVLSAVKTSTKAKT